MIVDVQILEVVPAVEIVGGTSLIIVTVDVDGGHVPLDIVHWNEFAPNANPVITEVGEEGVVTIPLPETSVHTPVPTVGVFPAKVAVEAQTVCVVPAFDTEGNGSRVTNTLTVEDGQTPFVILHW